MNNILTKIGYQGWAMTLNPQEVLFSKDGEHRYYDINNIIKVEVQNEYVFLYLPDGGFYQVKFEENNFLVIDIYDKDDEFVDTFGHHVFGED